MEIATLCANLKKHSTIYTTTNLKKRRQKKKERKKIGQYVKLYYNSTICKIQTVDNYTESAIQAVQQINKGKGEQEMERDFLEKMKVKRDS